MVLLKPYVNRIYTTDNISLDWVEVEPAIQYIISYDIDKINKKIIFKKEELIRSPF